MAREDEFLERHFLKEEEFLDTYGYGGILTAARKAIEPDEWHPDKQCNDGVRQSREYFIRTGELTAFAFKSAAVYHRADGFSSAQILLETAIRLVNVRVTKEGNSLRGEKIVDKAK